MSLSIAAGIRSSSSMAGLIAPPSAIEPHARRDAALNGRAIFLLLLLLLLLAECNKYQLSLTDDPRDCIVL